MHEYELWVKILESVSAQCSSMRGLYGWLLTTSTYNIMLGYAHMHEAHGGAADRRE